MVLYFYFDGVSQPSRAVWLVLEINGVSYEKRFINIARGEGRTEEYLKISPNGRVPAISDNGFNLCESAAIMKYLIAQYQLPDHWYPTDIKRRAKIDEYLSWHTANLREGAATYIFSKYIGKKIMGIVPNEKRLKSSYDTLQRSMDILESHFLKETPFINSNEISIADIQALCELTQFWLVDIDPIKERPRLSKWMQDCLKCLNPHFDKVHQFVYMARDKGIFKSQL